MLYNQRTRSPTSPALPRAQIGLLAPSLSPVTPVPTRLNLAADLHAPRHPSNCFAAPPIPTALLTLAIPYPPPSIPSLAPPPPSPPIPIDRRPHVFRGHGTADPRRPRPRRPPIRNKPAARPGFQSSPTPPVPPSTATGLEPRLGTTFVPPLCRQVVKMHIYSS